MMMLFKTTILLLMILTILNVISNLLKSKKMNKEKTNPFECGFDPQHKMRASFSLRFFILTIIFLIFDVEIAAMLAIPLSTHLSSLNTTLWNLMIWSMLLSGMVFEWKQGALYWN